MSVMNLGMQYVWLILFGGAVSWTKGKSTRDQEIVKHTNVLELGKYINKTLDFITKHFDNVFFLFHQKSGAPQITNFLFLQIYKLKALPNTILKH